MDEEIKRDANIKKQVDAEQVTRVVYGITTSESVDLATGYQLGAGIPALIAISDDLKETGAISLKPMSMFLSDVIKLYAVDGVHGYSKEMTEPITYYKNPHMIFDPVGSHYNKTGADRVWHCDPTGRPIKNES